MASLKDLIVMGPARFLDKLYGNLEGNATSADKLKTARSINGTNFDGTSNITTANWGTARTITIGNKGQSVNGSQTYSWSLSEIGAVAKSGDTMTGDLKFTTNGIHFIPGNTDQYLWKVYSTTDGEYGFRLQYNGTGSGNNNSLSLIADNQTGTEVNAATILQDGSITLAETLTLAKTTDASGTANNKPALIVGGTSTTAHLELDNNELMAKSNGTTVGELYLNANGGLVHIGTGGLQADASNIEALSSDEGYRAVKATNSNGSVGVYAASNRGLKDFTANDWIIYFILY